MLVLLEVKIHVCLNQMHSPFFIPKVHMRPLLCDKAWVTSFSLIEYIYIQQINNDIYDEGYIHFLLKLT